MLHSELLEIDLKYHVLILAAIVLLHCSSAFVVADTAPFEVIKVTPVAIDDEFKNHTSPEYEKAFAERTSQIIRTATRQEDGSFRKVYDNTYFENEKRSYPDAMFHILAGDSAAGLKVLQAPDEAAKSSNAHTLGIDLYPAFTLKGQVRKYFYFGSKLEPAYRERMKQAITIWTKTDPRTTPSPLYQKFNPKIEGWGPDRFGNRQVDSRNTDNLRAMRDIAIYLFAEEAGNRQTMEAAKKDIIFYVQALYSVGMGEWDSDTYLCHSFAPYLSLYDFAKDPQMKRVAKAALDYFSTAAALKYHAGVFSGPEKRDYGNGYRLAAGSGFGKFFSIYFGQFAQSDRVKEPDLIHAITSAYRPPAAVLALAERKFDRPVEVLGTKPVYENWKDGARDRPGYFETLFFAHTYDLGSIVSPTGDGDTGPFRMTAASTQFGAEVINASSRNKLNEKFSGDQIGQYRNLILWLRPTDKAGQFTFFLPKSAAIETKDGVQFIKTEKTWLAIRPINLGSASPTKMDEKATAEFNKKYPDSQLVSCSNGDGAYAGFAMEVGELPQSFEEFSAAIVSKSKLDLADLSRGKVRLTGADGRYVEMIHNAAGDLPVLDRNGIVRRWDAQESLKLWQTVGDTPLVSLGWKEGTLKVSADGHTFESACDSTGEAKFTDR